MTATLSRARARSDTRSWHFQSTRQLDQVALVLKAMGHPLRLRLLMTLAGDELSITELRELIGSSQTNVSQHLGILHEGGLVTRRQRGSAHFYRTRQKELPYLLAFIQGIVD